MSAISRGVAGRALRWRARAALLKGASLLLLGSAVLVSTIWMMMAGTLPKAETMGVIGVLALVANFACALMLWGHREGDANRRPGRSEEHTAELQSPMRTSYAVFCLEKKKTQKNLDSESTAYNETT